MRSQDLRHCVTSFGAQVASSTPPHLVQPGPAPLQGSILVINSRFVGKQGEQRLALFVTIDIAVEHVPVGAARIESIEPVLAKIESLVLDAVKAEHAKTRP